MAEEEEGARPVRPESERRGRGAVAASIVGVLLIGGYFAASRGELGALPAGYLVSAVVLVIAFWFPAVRIGAVRDVVATWRPLAVWLLAWTLVWDLASAGVLGERAPFEDWWVVYPAGVGVLAGLLVLHGAVVERVARRRVD